MNNVDLIYRSVAEDALTMLGAQLPESKTKAVARCVMEIHQLPSADALPVRYAEWIYDPADIGGYACRECRTRRACGYEILPGVWSEDDLVAKTVERVTICP